MARFDVRPMERSEVDLAIEWAAGEGWNPGRHDARAFYATDESGFWLGTLDGVPVSTISVVDYDHRFGFVGFYIVRPDMRGRGFGLATWNAALPHLDGLVVGLDGVLRQEETYRGSGFEAAWRNERHVLSTASTVEPSNSTVPLASVPFDAVLAYDALVFPADRRRFLEAWISMPDTMTAAVKDGDELLGWGLRRPCRDGHKVGPLFADGPDIADAIFRDLAADVDGPLFLDVPEPNTPGIELVQHHDMPLMFDTVRMYRGKTPDIALHRIFGVTTFELG
jgi:GNAT superfamily N-acetyltransferase